MATIGLAPLQDKDEIFRCSFSRIHFRCFHVLVEYIFDVFMSYTCRSVFCAVQANVKVVEKASMNEFHDKKGIQSILQFTKQI